MARQKHFPKALSGAAVTGDRAGKFAAEYARGSTQPQLNSTQLEGLGANLFAPLKRTQGIEVDHIIIKIQEVLLPYEITVISRGDRLAKAIKEVERLKDEEIPLLYASNAHYVRLVHEVKSMALVAEMYLKSRLLREESRDGCLREDYPYTDNINWLKWTMLKEENGRMKLWTQDIPAGREAEPKTGKYLYPVFEVARKKGIRWG
jgi:succinate dehydrogenase/fumarate reductase flavoprotein subunit